MADGKRWLVRGVAAEGCGDVGQSFPGGCYSVEVIQENGTVVHVDTSSVKQIPLLTVRNPLETRRNESEILLGVRTRDRHRQDSSFISS